MTWELSLNGKWDVASKGWRVGHSIGEDWKHQTPREICKEFRVNWALDWGWDGKQQEMSLEKAQSQVLRGIG